MFGRMMNNYYYGKSGKGDYNKDDLPKNRRQLFFEMLRIRFSALARLNLMTVIAFVPIMYILGQLLSNTLNLMNIVMTAEADMAAATEEMLLVYNNRFEALYGLVFMACLYLIPAITITGPVQAGLAYITRNWARDEHAFIFSDFKDAVKENWKQGLAVSFITSLVPIVMLVCYKFYGDMAKGNVIYIVPQMLTLSLGAIWMLGLSFMYPLIVSYKTKLSNIIKNGLLLAIGRLPQTIAIRLTALLPIIIASFVAFFTPLSIYAIIVIAGYYLFLGNALSRFIFASYTNAVFDKYINVNIPNAKINRGLSEEKDDEDEEIDG